ncbi:MAG: hypothetical protein QW331_00145 [Candidatus Woesearchaeota archaeon]
MRVSFDYDGVLGDFFAGAWIKALEQQGVACREEDILYHNLEQNIYRCLHTGAPQTLAKSKVERMLYEIAASGGYREIPPIEGAQEAIERLARDGHEIFVITSRKNIPYENDFCFGHVRRDTLFALARDFPQIKPENVHFQNKKTKAQICKELRIEYHVDDFDKVVEELIGQEDGLTLPLLYSRPWNMPHPSLSDKENAKRSLKEWRVENWEDIYNLITEKAFIQKKIVERIQRLYEAQTYTA